MKCLPLSIFIQGIAKSAVSKISRIAATLRHLWHVFFSTLCATINHPNVSFQMLFFFNIYNLWKVFVTESPWNNSFPTFCIFCPNSIAMKRGRTSAVQSESPKDTVKPTKEAKQKDKPKSDTYSHWLLKSEPNSRFENGIDMKVQKLL